MRTSSNNHVSFIIWWLRGYFISVRLGGLVACCGCVCVCVCVCVVLLACLAVASTVQYGTLAAYVCLLLLERLQLLLLRLELCRVVGNLFRRRALVGLGLFLEFFQFLELALLLPYRFGSRLRRFLGCLFVLGGNFAIPLGLAFGILLVLFTRLVIRLALLGRLLLFLLRHSLHVLLVGLFGRHDISLGTRLGRFGRLPTGFGRLELGRGVSAHLLVRLQGALGIQAGLFG